MLINKLENTNLKGFIQNRDLNSRWPTKICKNLRIIEITMYLPTSSFVVLLFK